MALLIGAAVIVFGVVAVRLRWIDLSDKTKRGKPSGSAVLMIGDEVFAVRKPFAADSFTRPGRPCPVSEAVREIALRSGEAFGLGLFGLDLIESPDGPVVVDVNYFPGYKGVEGAAPLIADFVRDYALERA
jgi:glutathione synthase/RimK-type ligase-like ATP-grasp enzyme